MYKYFRSEKVNAILDLGDLADSYNLRAEEITAISQALSYNKSIPEYHILGNHERLDETGTINSINFVENIRNHHIIKSVSQGSIDGLDATYIPYGIYEDGCFDNLESTKYAFSHIDIFGSDTGGWSLKSGLSPTYISSKFGLTVNGHIHNGSWVMPNKILNLGALSGQNFSSKVINWKPSVLIIDTDTDELKFVENPYALNFINKTCETVSDVLAVTKSLDKNLSYAIQLKVPVAIVEDAHKILDGQSNILVNRIMTLIDKSELGGLTYEEIEKVSSIEGGFQSLVEFINNQEQLPCNKEDILKVVTELEGNKLC